MRFNKVLILSFILFSLTVPVIPLLSSIRSPEKPQPVKIGLLLADSLSTAARNGAELAINEANKKGGLNGRPFELVVRSMEGPWGTGSKQAISLVFDEKVWAILGSHDGRNAHLAEQATAKTHVSLAWRIQHYQLPLSHGTSAVLRTIINRLTSLLKKYTTVEISPEWLWSPEGIMTQN